MAIKMNKIKTKMFETTIKMNKISPARKRVNDIIHIKNICRGTESHSDINTNSLQRVEKRLKCNGLQFVILKVIFSCNKYDFKFHSNEFYYAQILKRNQDTVHLCFMI